MSFSVCVDVTVSPPRGMCCTSTLLSACDQSLALSVAARSLFVNWTPSFQRVQLTIFALDSSTFVSRTVLSCWIVARISFTLLRRASLRDIILIGASRSSFASFHSFKEWNLVLFHLF